MAGIIASLFIAALSGMGVGSGGLFVIWLTLVTDTPQFAAQGLNLLFFLFSSGTSLLVHSKKRNILWGAVLVLSVVGIVGSLFGSFVAGFISATVMRKIFGSMLIVSGSFVLFARKKSVKRRDASYDNSDT